MENELELAQERENLRKSLNRARARLDELEMELASFGRLYAPLDLVQDHEQIRKSVAWLEVRLAELQGPAAFE